MKPVIQQLFREVLRRARMVTFDADGTLVDSREKVTAIHAALAPKYGLSAPLVYDGGSIPRQLEELGLSRFAQWRYLCEYRRREMQSRPLIFRGANELVRRLRTQGKIVGIVTNRPAEFRSFKLLWRSGLDLDAFDLVVTYDQYPRRVAWKKQWWLLGNAPKHHVSVAYPKPDKRAFDPVCELMGKIGCSPGEVAHFGDSIPDIMAAYENHFAPIGVLTGAVRDEAVFFEHGAQFVIPCITDARNYL
ncbi:MAG: HAD family hydrolase [Candidatus Harrisonbacteria bacterium]|nr:HAD family hydrolase [Candidatus Harrisonbacteria bacterium]